MQTARLVATWASCYQAERKIGAVIVKNKRIMTTGYNGAPAGAVGTRHGLRKAQRAPYEAAARRFSEAQYLVHSLPPG